MTRPELRNDSCDFCRSELRERLFKERGYTDLEAGSEAMKTLVDEVYRDAENETRKLCVVIQADYEENCVCADHLKAFVGMIEQAEKTEGSA